MTSLNFSAEAVSIHAPAGGGGGLFFFFFTFVLSFVPPPAGGGAPRLRSGVVWLWRCFNSRPREGATIANF